jgi:hypothetical protein
MESYFTHVSSQHNVVRVHALARGRCKSSVKSSVQLCCYIPMVKCVLLLLVLPAKPSPFVAKGTNRVMCHAGMKDCETGAGMRNSFFY